jgi:hypothetical protein
LGFEIEVDDVLVPFLLYCPHIVVQDLGCLKSAGGQKGVGKQECFSVAVFNEYAVVGKVTIYYLEVGHALHHTALERIALAATTHWVDLDWAAATQALDHER